jgi:hypothetical protein
MSDPPKTSYAKSGDVHIAYQVLGDGPIDLVWVPGFVSNVEYEWEHPRPARFFRRLASFSRLIRFDKRGTGLSDRVAIPTLEERMDDVRAVLDAAGSTRAAHPPDNLAALRNLPAWRLITLPCMELPWPILRRAHRIWKRRRTVTGAASQRNF